MGRLKPKVTGMRTEKAKEIRRQTVTEKHWVMEKVRPMLKGIRPLQDGLRY